MGKRLKKLLVFILSFSLILTLAIGGYASGLSGPKDATNLEDSDEVGNLEEYDGPEDQNSSEDPEDPEDLENPEGPEDLDNLEDQEDLENPEDPEDLENPEDPEDLENPEDPEDSENPEDPEDPENPEDPEELEDHEYPIDEEDPNLIYFIRYYVEGEESYSWEVEDVVSIDSPIVEEISHDDMPEGYILDEERSTALPFEISEENNLIEIYYIPSQVGPNLAYFIRYYVEGEKSYSWVVEDVVPVDNPIVEQVSYKDMPKGYILDEERSTELPFKVSEKDNVIEIYYVMDQKLGLNNFMLGSYYSDEEGVVVKTVLEGESINTHTIPELIWLKDGVVYAAVKSTHELEYMILNDANHIESDEYGAKEFIYVDDEPYDPDTELKGNTKDAHWTVFKFNLSDLPIPEDGKLEFFIKGIGGGHDVGGYMTVIVPMIDITGHKEWIGGGNWPSVTLVLKRQVEIGSYEVVATGIVNGSESPAWNYTWIDVAEYNPYGQPYIYFIDEEEVPMYYEKTLDGLTVINTFVPQGKIIITKYVENYDSAKNGGRVFDIFVEDQDGRQWTVRLKNGESKTIEGLPMGTYTISEIVPMNYKLVGISDGVVTLTDENNEVSVEVTNKPSNDGWFYDEDDRENKFEVGIVAIPLIHDMILPPESETGEVPVEDEG